MNLKDEYIKRIEIIKSRKENRLKEIELMKMDDREKEIKLEEKMEDYQNIIKEKNLSIEENNNELLILKDKIVPVSKVENFIAKYVNFDEKISKCEEKFKKGIHDLISYDKKNKRNTIIQELLIKGDFTDKNKILINKDDNLNKIIEDFDNKISETNILLKNKIKINQVSLGDKFINRNNFLIFLEKQYQKIHQNRIKNIDLEKKIKNQELENRIIRKKVENNGNLELTKLNQYIKSQKIYIKNELSTEKKKEYFKNIKNKNKEYLDKINKNRNRLEILNTKLNSLKEELMNNQNLDIDNISKKEKIPYKIKKEIKELKDKVENLKINKLSNTLEKKINLKLLEGNKIYCNEEIKDLCENYKKQSKKLSIDETKLRKDYFIDMNNLKINSKLQISDNKNNLKLFMEENLIKLYNFKGINAIIKNLKNSIKCDKDVLESSNKNLKNSEYVLKKTKLKNELKYNKLEEENNDKNIDDLIEMDEINQKILSISN